MRYKLELFSAHGALLGVALSLLNPAGASAEADDLTACGLKPYFMEDFTSESINVKELGSARWIAHTPWNGDFGDAAFANPGPGGPFSISNGILSITARKGEDGKWRSGLIAAADHNGVGEGVRYGYFESRMKMPPGPGTWPAFWLGTLRPSGAKGPALEIDVIEYYGVYPASFQSVVHVWYDDPKDHRAVAHSPDVPKNSLTDQFHTFGVMVDPTNITFYVDRHEVWQTKTPKEHTLPLFPLVNLALGAGFPITETPNPSVLLVDYVHVYSLESGSEPKKCDALRGK